MSESLGKCPLCTEGNIIEKEKNFVCSNADWSKDENDKWVNNGCLYSIYKFGLKKFGKKEISTEEVKELLSKGSVEVSFVTKKTIIADDKFGIKVLFKEEG